MHIKCIKMCTNHNHVPFAKYSTHYPVSNQQTLGLGLELTILCYLLTIHHSPSHPHHHLKWKVKWKVVLVWMGWFHVCRWLTGWLGTWWTWMGRRMKNYTLLAICLVLEQPWNAVRWSVCMTLSQLPLLH